jgi:hypothetical protein
MDQTFDRDEYKGDDESTHLHVEEESEKGQDNGGEDMHARRPQLQEH